MCHRSPIGFLNLFVSINEEGSRPRVLGDKFGSLFYDVEPREKCLWPSWGPSHSPIKWQVIETSFMGHTMTHVTGLAAKDSNVRNCRWRGGYVAFPGHIKSDNRNMHITWNAISASRQSCLFLSPPLVINYCSRFQAIWGDCRMQS